MREITIRILCNEKSKELRAAVTEKVNGTEATYPLHNFNVAFIAHLGSGPQSYADTSRDVRNQYHFRRSWEMLPELTIVPSVPTPTMTVYDEVAEPPKVLCIREQDDTLDQMPE